MYKIISSALALSLILLACGGSDSQEARPAGDVVQLTIDSDDTMRFNKERMEVESGKTVELTLTHSGRLPVQAMGHNWVLLAEDVDVDAFAQAALNAADNQYIPQDRLNEVIAYTSMIGGGETTSVTFTAPAPGTYVFICSFPGHAGIMRGELVVL